MMAAVRVLPFPLPRGASRRAAWPTLVTDDGGTVPADLTVDVGEQPTVSVQVALTHRGRTVQAHGTGSLGSALTDLAAALRPAHLRACATCRLATSGGNGAAGSQGTGGVWDLDGSGLIVGRICHRSTTPEPVLDTHWCDRYEPVGAPR